MNVPLMLFITEFKKEPSENILCLLEIITIITSQTSGKDLKWWKYY